MIELQTSNENAPANFWSSNAWNLETNMFVGNFNEEIRKYWTNTLDC